MIDEVELREYPSRDSDESTVYDPAEPFLDKGNAEDEAESQNARRPSATPLPKMKLASLCGVRLVDPIAFTQIFPYINEQITSIPGLIDDPSRTGFYSGMVVRWSFAFALNRPSHGAMCRRALSPSLNYFLSTNGHGCRVSLWLAPQSS
jgi:hypothetical protein